MLREVRKTDIAIFFKHQLDPVSNWQVAFTHEDPSEEVAGYLTKYDLNGEPQSGFVLGREFWGIGIATASLREFLSIVTVRPVYGRTAFDNEASMKVLQKVGFKRTAEGTYFSHARGTELVEVLWALE
jgi:RimJ/RimL family protein N-acetyltransferase